MKSETRLEENSSRFHDGDCSKEEEEKEGVVRSRFLSIVKIYYSVVVANFGVNNLTYILFIFLNLLFLLYP